MHFVIDTESSKNTWPIGAFMNSAKSVNIQGIGKAFCNGACKWNDAEGCTKSGPYWKGGRYLNICGHCNNQIVTKNLTILLLQEN